jgi:general secretion pathway protein K
MYKIISNNYGIALILTISVISLLIIISLGLNKNLRFALTSATSTKDRITLYHMASSGIYAGMAILIKDKYDSEIDSVTEDWANNKAVSEVVDMMVFENGKVTVSIVDEIGKLQINALVKYPEAQNFNETQKILWERFLKRLMENDESIDAITPTDILNSVKDWLDINYDNATTGFSGAESDYYEELNPPYQCKNGPFSYPEEIFLVKNVSHDLFKKIGGFGTILDFITTYGMTDSDGNKFMFKGNININTAPLPVIAALLPLEDQDLAPDIYNYRIEKSDNLFIHDLKNITWYKNVPGCTDLKIDKNIITLSSDFFTIKSTAAINNMDLTITAVIKREKNKDTKKIEARIISWKTD